MRGTTYAGLLSVLCGSVSAAFFTEPEQGSSLNISAPITLKWDKPEIPDARGVDEWRFLQIKMRFVMPSPDDKEPDSSWNEEVGANLTLSRAGEAEWDPSNVREFLEENYNDSKEREKPYVEFYADITGPSDGLTAPMETGEHDIVGYGGKEGSAMAVLPVWLLVAVGVLVAI